MVEEGGAVMERVEAEVVAVGMVRVEAPREGMVVQREVVGRLAAWAVAREGMAERAEREAG